MKSVQAVIWLALTVAMGMMTAFSLFFVPEMLQLDVRSCGEVWQTHQGLVLGAGGAAVILLTLSRLFRNPDSALVKTLLKAPGHIPAEGQKTNVEAQGFIVSMALLEAVAICGFLLSMKTQSQVGFPLASVALLTAFSMRPKSPN